MLFILILIMLWIKGLKYEDSKFDEIVMCFIKKCLVSCMLYVFFIFIENNIYIDMYRCLIIIYYFVMVEVNLEKLYMLINLSLMI